MEAPKPVRLGCEKRFMFLQQKDLPKWVYSDLRYNERSLCMPLYAYLAYIGPGMWGQVVVVVEGS